MFYFEFILFTEMGDMHLWTFLLAITSLSYGFIVKDPTEKYENISRISITITMPMKNITKLSQDYHGYKKKNYGIATIPTLLMKNYTKLL